QVGEIVFLLSRHPVFADEPSLIAGQMLLALVPDPLWWSIGDPTSQGTSDPSRPRSAFIERTRHFACAKNSLTFRTLITTTRSGARKADSVRFNLATGSGTRIARSSAYQRVHRCFTRVRYRQSADTRNLPMSARPTMRFPRR